LYQTVTKANAPFITNYFQKATVREQIKTEAANAMSRFKGDKTLQTTLNGIRETLNKQTDLNLKTNEDLVKVLFDKNTSQLLNALPSTVKVDGTGQVYSIRDLIIKKLNDAELRLSKNKKYPIIISEAASSVFDNADLVEFFDGLWKEWKVKGLTSVSADVISMEKLEEEVKKGSVKDFTLSDFDFLFGPNDETGEPDFAQKELWEGLKGTNTKVRIVPVGFRFEGATGSGNKRGKMVLGKDAFGFYDASTDCIYIPPIDGSLRGEARKLLIHENIHSITEKILTADEFSLNSVQKLAKQHLEDAYQELKALNLKDENGKEWYGLDSVNEMVSELGNTKFRNAIQDATEDTNPN